jgi:hypothetical protein
MKSAGAGNSSGKNLAALADELSQLSGILVVDISDLLLTENANLFSSAVRAHIGAAGVLSSIHDYEILLCSNS